MKCVEVCPNRANTLVRVPAGFRDEVQIVHIDAFCNECGNCATFCPWEGRPYKDKLTVFASEEDFSDSTNPGFFLQGAKGTLRVGGMTGRLQVDGANRDGRARRRGAPSRMVQAIVRDYRYLLGRRMHMILLKNATLVHLHPAEVIPGVDIVIDGTEIQAVGRAAGKG